jgi:hypothetical protein
MGEIQPGHLHSRFHHSREGLLGPRGRADGANDGGLEFLQSFHCRPPLNKLISIKRNKKNRRGLLSSLILTAILGWKALHRGKKTDLVVSFFNARVIRSTEGNDPQSQATSSMK